VRCVISTTNNPLLALHTGLLNVRYYGTTRNNNAMYSCEIDLIQMSVYAGVCVRAAGHALLYWCVRMGG